MPEKQISEKQLNANRENAKKSTGPTSEQGKQKARVNAGRHHLTGQVHTMTDEDHAEYNKLLHSFTDEYRPEGALMTSLVANIAHAFWRLNRAHAMEENYFTLEAVGREPRVKHDHPQIQFAMCQTLTFFEQPEKFVLLSLYEQRTHNRLQKDLKMLLDLTAKREKQPQPRPAVPPETVMTAGSAPAAPTEAAESAPIESATSAENGFVFSNAFQPRPEAASEVEIASEPLHPDTEIPNAA